MMNRAMKVIALGIITTFWPGVVAGQLHFREPSDSATKPPLRVAAAQTTATAPTAPPRAHDEAALTTQPSPRATESLPLPKQPNTMASPIDATPIFSGADDPAPFVAMDQEAAEYLLDEPAAAQEIYSTGSMFMNGQWYVQQEATELMRTGVKDRAIARAYQPVATSATTGVNVATLHSLNMSSVPLRFQPGMRMTVGRILGIDHGNRQHAVELSFWGLFDWSNSFSLASVFAPNDISTVLSGDPFNTDTRVGQSGAGIVIQVGQNANTIGTQRIIVPGFSSTGLHTIKYGADLNSYELNYRLLGRPARDRLALQPDGTWVRTATSSNIKSVFAGIRGVTVNELFLYTSESTTSDEPRGLFEVRLNNRLVGPQIGGQVVERHHNWLFGFRAKTGGLVNFSRRNSLLDGFDRAETRRLREEIQDEHLTFLGEAGVFTSYEFTGTSSLRLSYDVLYLNGIASATPNISMGNNFGPMNIESGAIYHGVSAGYELVW